MNKLKNIGLMTQQEVAEVLGVSTATLRRWSKTGILPRVCTGRKIYYRVSDLKRMAQKGGNDGQD